MLVRLVQQLLTVIFDDICIQQPACVIYLTDPAEHTRFEVRCRGGPSLPHVRVLCGRYSLEIGSVFENAADCRLIGNCV